MFIENISHNYFSLERKVSSEGKTLELNFMFNDEYAFEFNDLVDFLVLLQQDPQLWKVLVLRYAAKRAVQPDNTLAKEVLSWLPR